MPAQIFRGSNTLAVFSNSSRRGTGEHAGIGAKSCRSAALPAVRKVELQLSTSWEGNGRHKSKAIRILRSHMLRYGPGMCRGIETSGRAHDHIVVCEAADEPRLGTAAAKAEYAERGSCSDEKRLARARAAAATRSNNPSASLRRHADSAGAMHLLLPRLWERLLVPWAWGDPHRTGETVLQPGKMQAASSSCHVAT